MKATPLYIALIASVVFVAPTLAQDKSSDTTANTAVESSPKHERMKREPIDLTKFSQAEELKAIDTNRDGILSREEIETHALKMMIKRAADRIERRLDVNGDKVISLSAIEKARAEKFSELDTNKDGKLDRGELKAGKGKHGKSYGKNHGQNHGKRGHGDQKRDQNTEQKKD